jgi:ubiquinone/menaquinone biosynthesis C-methylase UbiE
MPNDHSDSVYETSRRIYSHPRTVRFYAGRSFLLEAEKVIFDFHGDDLRGRRILDLGVGCGRTTEYLLRLSRDYVGVDYAAAMIEHCRSRFPGVAFCCCDASDLGRFPSESFDVVVFSFNGLDHAFPARRMTMLGEMHRVLHRRGLVIFSAHNLLVDRGSAFHAKGPVRCATLLESVQLNGGRMLDFLRGVYYYLRNRRREEYGDGYAVVVDQLDQYRHLMYYITPAAQFAQLRHAGFLDIEAYARNGSRIGPDDLCRDWWIYYVARKGPVLGPSATQPL